MLVVAAVCSLHLCSSDISIQIPIADPPELHETAARPDTKVQLDLKCSKPQLQYTLTGCSLSATISSLKQQLVDSRPADTVPGAADQKWLIKGKVLQDAKLLQEYTQEPAASITLMLKPGSTFSMPFPCPSETSSSTAPASASSVPTNKSPNTLSSSTASNRGHIRVPSLTLNTSDLEPETDTGPKHTRPRALSASFTTKMADPAFWKDVLDFLEKNVDSTNCVRAWEEWFSVSKQWLTPSDVAKIREHVGCVLAPFR